MPNDDGLQNTCTYCRKKKTRCDSARPICGPCSRARNRGNQPCVYEASRVGPSSGPLLLRGSACLPCRTKKKKCDGQRPSCGICRSLGKEDDCEYNDGSSRTQQLQSRIVELEALVQRLSMQSSSSAGTSGPSVRSESDSMENIDFDFGSTLLSPDDPGFLQGGLSVVSAHQSDYLFDTVPSYHLPSTPAFIIPVPDFPGSFVHSPEPEFPLSRGHMNTMELRAQFLLHRHQLGLDLSSPKLTAIRNGDLTGSIVHPVLVYLAEVWGAILDPELRFIAYTEWEVATSQSIRHFLADRDELRKNPLLHVQVSMYFSIYFIVRGQLSPALSCYEDAARVVMQYNLRLIPFPSKSGTDYSAENRLRLADDASLDHGPAPQLEPWILDADDVQEHNGVLCELLYLEFTQNMDLGTSYRIPFEIRLEIESSLKFVHSLPALRLRSILSLVKAREQISMFSEISNNTAIGVTQEEWFTYFWDFLDQAMQLTTQLKHLLARSTFYGWKQLSHTLRACIVITNTAIAELHQLMLASSPESRRAVLTALDEILSVTLPVPDWDYRYLDPVLVPCWRSNSAALSDLEMSMTQGDFMPESSFRARKAALATFEEKMKRAVPFLVYGSARQLRRPHVVP